MADLTQGERDQLAALIAIGQSLPESYRDLLFPSQRREAELTYTDKERDEDIIANTMAVPFQPARSFGRDRSDSHQGTSAWSHNRLIFGDNLQAMKTLLRMKEDGELVNADGQHGIKLIYLDPPFATRKDFSSSAVDERAYQDKLVGAQFLEFLRKRLILARELMAPNGNIYVHLDERKSHYVKVLMDEIFGEHRFQREIIWRIGWVSGFKTKAQNWIRNHDVILYYSFDQRTFNKSYIPYPPGYTRRDGSPPTGEGYPYEDTWNSYEMDRLNSIQIVSYSGEKTGFPTQKNEHLLERIILASSDEGDIVLDPVSGSGTTPAVCDKLARRWIAVDCAKLSMYVTQRRMLNLRSETGNTGEPMDPQPFTLYNAGLYQFSTLRKLPWPDWRSFALQLFECRDEPHTVGGIEFDGYRHGSDVIVFNHLLEGGAVLDYGFIDSLHAQAGGSLGSQVFIIAPAASVAFLEDYVEKGGCRFYVLRIPYSIIRELHVRDFESLRQPIDETQVNETVEAVGFDFIRPPDVTCSYSIIDREGTEYLQVAIEEFSSQALGKSPVAEEGFSALSMVLIDRDYQYDEARNGAQACPPFQVDDVLYGSELSDRGWSFEVPVGAIGTALMLVFIDVRGNEHTEVKAREQLPPHRDAVGS